MHCATRRRASRSELFLSKFVLRMCTNYYFQASGQNSDITVRFDDSDFLYGTYILAIGEQHLWPYFHCDSAETAISEVPVKIQISTLDAFDL